LHSNQQQIRLPARTAALRHESVPFPDDPIDWDFDLDGTQFGTGSEPQPSPDGPSHLTLITCAGTIVNGQFDHHTVVYATRSK
jgi:hypothetical protein